MPEATITPTTPTPIARRVARPRAGSVTDRRQARIGVEPPATQDPDKGARAADTTASAVLAGVAETAIALAIGQKPDTTAQRRARAQQRASQAIVPIDPNAEPVMMELIGLTSDGRLVQFWDKEYPVRRVNKFLDHPKGPWIKDGKYLISYRGHLITCHCGNMTNGNVSVQIMCNDAPAIHLPRHMIEPMLWGYVVPDEAAEREVSEALRSALAALRARDEAPSRQRGHL